MMRVLVVAVLALLLAPASEAGFFRRKQTVPKPQGPRYGLSQREQARDAAKARKARNKAYRWKRRR